ncbi:MAG: exosortase/archaeosortase family protein [Bacteroidales bacterium]|nr:exosortase/archaeosortase family protein [Bacteroidales bacterium]
MIKDFYTNSVSFIKKYKLQPIVDVGIFAIIIVFFHFLWWGGLKAFLLNYMAFHQLEGFLAHQVFLPAAWIVENILQYPIKTVGNTLFFENNGYVEVVGSCSGLKQFYQWFVLILLFPGPWKKKLWYIPAGLLVIHLVNILRIVTLSVVTVHWPAQWDFIHLWVLRPFFYVVIFVMWMIWEEKFRLPALGRKG